MIVYGSAIYTILKYDKLIKGARAEVSKKRNAAWPFGVAILGIFVPVLIAIVRLLKCSKEILPASRRALTSFI